MPGVIHSMQVRITMGRGMFPSDAMGRIKWATGLAVLFHLTGLLGMAFIDRPFFAALTPFNLLLMSLLNVWSGSGHWKRHLAFPVLAYATGMCAEIVGVNTGALFGAYSYGHVLGPKWMGVPWLIGLNWFLVVSGSLALADQLHGIALRLLPRQVPLAFSRLAPLSRVATAACLAVFFDRVMEPVAIKLGFWTWHDGTIPLFNYVCWFLVSLWLILLGRRFSPAPHAGFTANLYLIQVLFFLLLGLFL